MTRRDTLHRIIVASVLQGNTLHKGPMDRVQTVQRAFVVSVVLSSLSTPEKKERAPVHIDRLCLRGCPELSPRREDTDFLSAPPTLAKSGILSGFLKLRTRREKESEALSEIQPKGEPQCN